MKFICEAEDYSVEEKEDYAIVKNQLYSSKLCMLWLTAFLEFLLPDPSSYKAPKCIIIKNHPNDDIVTIDRKLNVVGTTDYEYVMISSQYEKWKKSYLIANYMTIFLSFLIVAFVTYISFADGPNWYGIGVLVVVVTFPVFIIRKTLRELSAAKKLRKIDL